MATNVNPTTGKTFVTGESVTAAKLNTQVDASTVLVNDIDTGSSVSSGGSDIFKQKATNDLEFKGIVGGTNITLSSSATDVTINNDNVGATWTGTNTTGGVVYNIGTIRIAHFQGDAVLTGSLEEVDYDITGAGFTTITSTHVCGEATVLVDNQCNLFLKTVTDVTEITAFLVKDSVATGAEAKPHITVVGT